MSWGLAQPATNVNPGSNQNPQVAYGQAVNAGDLLIAIIGFTSATVTLSGLTDSQGNTWSIDSTEFAAAFGDRFIAICRAVAKTSGPCTVTFALSAAASAGIILYDFTVPGSAPALDGTPVVNAAAATTTASVGPLTTTQSGDLVISALRGGSVSGVGSGWTLDNNAAGAIAAQFIVQTSAGSISASYTQANSGYAAIILAYYSSPIPPAPPPAPATITQNHTAGLAGRCDTVLNAIVKKHPLASVQDVNGNLYRLRTLLARLLVSPQDPRYNPGLRFAQVEWLPDEGTISWIVPGGGRQLLYTILKTQQWNKQRWSPDWVNTLGQ